MTTISKRDAMRLAADIRDAHVGGYAHASRWGGADHYGAAMAAFIGGLEVVLRHFVLQHGCSEAAEALVKAMSDTPTEAEIATRNERMARLCSKAKGGTA